MIKVEKSKGAGHFARHDACASVSLLENGALKHFSSKNSYARAAFIEPQHHWRDAG